jgi:hypothetical protein
MRTGTDMTVRRTNAEFSIFASREAITGMIWTPATRTIPRMERIVHAAAAIHM